MKPVLGLAVLLFAGLFMLAAPQMGRAQGPSPTDAQRAIAEYRLGSGDRVKVTVFGEDTLTGEYSISATGRVSLPLIGELEAGGKTIAQLQAEIIATLKNGYILDPKVSAEVETYRPFFILGEVQKPGTYPYTAGLTVLNAVATANGFTYRANKKRFFLKREGESSEHEYPLMSGDQVAPGDTIRIGERYF